MSISKPRDLVQSKIESIETLIESNRKTISRDLTSGIIISVILVSMIVISTTYMAISINLDRNFRSKLDDYAETLANNLELPLWNMNDKSLEKIGLTATEDEFVGKLVVKDDLGSVIFHYLAEKGRQLLEKRIEIHHDGRTIGILEIGLSDNIYNKSRRNVLLSSIITVFSVVLVLFLMTKILVQRFLRRPLDDLIRQIDSVADEQTHEILDVRQYRQREIQWIIVRFNRMISRLQEREEALKNLNRKLSQEIEERKEVELERKRLEAQFFRAQKMESLGTLAGGIAHDFNNLLMVIQGRTSLMQIDTDADHRNYDHLNSIKEYVKRASELTRQLLGFARGGKVEVVSSNIDEILKKSAAMFGRTHKDIEIHYDLFGDVHPVEIDRGQIDQVLMNLFVNAWQAMPEGGDLFIGTENILLSPEEGTLHSVRPGDFVRITVRDTGIGMDEATQQKVFDPFFTTKEMGMGTGLGLASAYGIIKNHEGIISVTSRVGEGSRFDILLPASKKKISQTHLPAKKIEKGEERILLIDDEKMVIKVGTKMMEYLGYTILSATSGKEAIRIFEERHAEIDMVVLDMIMPEMGGKEIFYHLKKIVPDVKVLLASGYSLEGQGKEMMAAGCSGFIQKPFDMDGLSNKILEILSK